MPKKLKKGGNYHLTIDQKRKTLKKWEEPTPNNKNLSSRVLAAHFSALWERNISKSSIQDILDKRNQIYSLPKKAGKHEKKNNQKLQNIFRIELR